MRGCRGDAADHRSPGAVLWVEDDRIVSVTVGQLPAAEGFRVPCAADDLLAKPASIEHIVTELLGRSVPDAARPAAEPPFGRSARPDRQPHGAGA